MINPERIRWCCADYGITPLELASELGIAEASMDRVMAGHAGMTFNQLRKLAEYFGRGVLFFVDRGQINESQMHTPQFRTLANQKPELSAELKALIERVETQRAIYLSLREDIDDSDQIAFDPPSLPRHDLREAAQRCRKWLGLEKTNGFASYRAAVAAQGILVFQSNGYKGKWQIEKASPILGFALYDKSCPVIVIKKQDWESQQSFTLMHELGHLLLHKTSSIDSEQDLQSRQGNEREANGFAGHLLVPDEFLESVHDTERPDDVAGYNEWLGAYRKAWGVSTEVILRRLLDAGRLSQRQYSDYRQWMTQVVVSPKQGGSREYRHREPMHVFGDTFVRTVLDALDASNITLAKASTYLDGLKIKDLHKLEAYYYAGL